MNLRVPGKVSSPVTLPVFEVTGDKASMQRQYFDMGTMLRQLGIGGWVWGR
jgi:limonene-1,2-epoxide hydrolase